MNSSFTRTASAPASLTALCSAECASPVSAITHMLGWSFLNRATALTPSSRGMCRSITTASGESSSASSIAARPSCAVPTTASSGWRSIKGDSASRKGSSSSARRTRIIVASRIPNGRDVSLAAVSLQAKRKVAVIGAALDLGAGRRGVDMGPSAIRYAGLDARIADLGHGYHDLGNVGTAVPEAIDAGDEHARFLPQIKDTCLHIAELVAEAAGDGSVPIVLGGDHSVALGTLGGLNRAHG